MQSCAHFFFLLFFLQACASIFSKLCVAIPIVKLETALLRSGAVEALAQLVCHAHVRTAALECLFGLCADIETSEMMIRKGILGPLVQLLCQWKRALSPESESAGLWREIRQCLRLLTILSRVDMFAVPFLALGGHVAVMQIIDESCCSEEALKPLGGEVLVNMLCVTPEAADQLSCPCKSLARLVIENTLMATENEALRSRSLDVLSNL